MVAGSSVVMSQLTEQTQWTENIDPARSRGAALNRLATSYSRRIVERMRRKWGRATGDEADDLVQSFLVKLMEGDIVRNARRERGRFRAFLDCCVDNHVRDWLSRNRTLTLDAPEELVAAERLDSSTDDRAWAEELLRQALVEVEHRCDAAGNEVLRGILHDQVMRPILQGCVPLTYLQIAGKFNLESTGVAAGKVRTAHSWIRTAVRSLIRQFAIDDSEVEHEIGEFIRHLADALAFPWDATTFCSILHSDLSCDLPSFDSMEWISLIESRTPTPTTYMDLFSQPQPSHAWLDLVKRFAKDQLRRPSKAVPRDSAKLLYLLAGSVSLTQGLTPVSSLSASELRQGLESMVVKIQDTRIRLLIHRQCDRISQLDA